MMAAGKKSAFNADEFMIPKKKEIPKKESDTHDTHNTHDTHDTHDTKQRKQKHPRINMAFYGDNLEYLKEAAWNEKISVTEYVNKLVEADRKNK